jgi:hypothetical protein
LLSGLQDRNSTLPDSLTLGWVPGALYHGRFSASISCEQPLFGSTLGIPLDLRLNHSSGPLVGWRSHWRTGVGCSAPGHLHKAPSLCRVHGNVIHGGPAGALVSSPYSTRSTECPKGSPLGQGCSPVLRRDLFPNTKEFTR